MVPLVQFAFVLVLAAAPALLVTALLRQPARRRGGDPVAFPLRRSLG
jgi:hypothetical protein